MNFKGISFYLSLFCFPISFLAFINILYATYFDYFLSIETYFITLVFSLILGFGLFYLGKNSIKKINYIDQLVLIISTYFLISILIAIPFYMSNYQVTLVNSIFEAISGLTGTGFSIFKNIKYLDPTLILWRSSSQWIGGLYFLIFLILLFSNKSFNFKMTQLTYTGESNFKSVENIKNTKIFSIEKKYQFLDNICLKVLKNNPDKMAKIFYKMFNCSPNTVINFLSNKSNILEDVSIISKMPKWIFLKQLI